MKMTIFFRSKQVCPEAKFCDISRSQVSIIEIPGNFILMFLIFPLNFIGVRVRGHFEVRNLTFVKEIDSIK